MNRNLRFMFRAEITFRLIFILLSAYLVHNIRNQTRHLKCKMIVKYLDIYSLSISLQHAIIYSQTCLYFFFFFFMSVCKVLSQTKQYCTQTNTLIELWKMYKCLMRILELSRSILCLCLSMK